MSIDILTYLSVLIATWTGTGIGLFLYNRYSYQRRMLTSAMSRYKGNRMEVLSLRKINNERLITLRSGDKSTDLHDQYNLAQKKYGQNINVSRSVIGFQDGLYELIYVEPNGPDNQSIKIFDKKALSQSIKNRGR